MTAKDASDLAFGYMRLNIRNIYLFIGAALLFGGWIILSPDVNETEPYADQRKIAAIGYTFVSAILLVLSLKLMTRMNAALRAASSLRQSPAEIGQSAAENAQTPAENVPLTRLLRPVSLLWILFPMTAIMIVVNYIILIYAVDGGLF